jgi:hypothetical protein
MPTTFHAATSTSFSYTIVFVPPPCSHLGILLELNAECQEVRFACAACRRTIGVDWHQIVDDPTNDQIRGILSVVFGPHAKSMRMPWEHPERCTAVGQVYERDILPSSVCAWFVRSVAGLLAHWLWRYGVYVS